MAEEEQSVRGLLDVETEVAFSGPAPVANRFFIHSGALVRLSFAEQAGEPFQAQFRSAVTLHPHDAIELHKLLGEMVKQYIRDEEDDGGS